MITMRSANTRRNTSLQRRHVLVQVMALLTLGSTNVLAEPPRVLRMTRIGRGAALTRMEDALRMVWAKLGYQLEFVDMPGERALVETNDGRTDGETARIAGMEATYPDLRRVDVPLYINTNSTFVYGAGKPIPATVSELRTLASVGIVRGWKASEDATYGWRNVIKVNSYASALQMLKLGRMDAFLGRGEDTLRAIQQEGLNPADFPNKVVLRHSLFHYLHKKHEALLPLVARELLLMKGNNEAVVSATTLVLDK